MNVNEIYHLIISSRRAAEDLIKSLSKKQPQKENKSLYMRCLYKSVEKTTKYHKEYERIIRLLFDIESEYTAEFIKHMDQFLKTLTLQVSFFSEFVKIQCTKLSIFSEILQRILQCLGTYHRR